MALRFEFTEGDFVKLCVKNTSREKTTISQDIYDAFATSLNASITPESKVTEIRHSYNAAYHDKHLSLIDYLNIGFIEFYYPKMDIYSKKEHDLDIDEIVMPSFIELKEVSYGFIAKTIDIKEHNLKTKNRTTVTFLHMCFGRDIIRKIIEHADKTSQYLLPSRLDVYEWRQTFYNKITGGVFFCKCFETAIHMPEVNILGNCHEHIKRALRDNCFKESICHLCTSSNSDLFYCHPMYGSTFKVKYGAYIRKVSIENNIDEREAENIVREKKGVSRIGEKWINETLLFNYIKILFPQHNVMREASPSWLEKQRLDIYIPEIGLGIEYQGEQHYKPIGLFGGQEGLKRTKDRDQEKLKRCKRNNVEIIFFTYKENLSEKIVEAKLKRYLDPEHSKNRKA